MTNGPNKHSEARNNHSEAANMNGAEMTTVEAAPTMSDDQLDGMLVQRARDLAEVLRSRAADAVANRRLPAETVADLKASGLLKVLQARRNGGYERPMRTHLEVIAALAEGCASTSWVVGVTHAHSWMMSHFPEAAQRHTYGTDPDTFISAVIAPRGRAERVEGGYRLSGTWPFASGSENSQYLFLGAAVFDGGQEVDQGEFLVPTRAATFKDDWHVTGLAGTGSCSVVLTDVEVPEAHYLSMAALMTGDSPGAPLHDGWQHRAAATPVLILALAGSALGIARRALADFPAVIGDKVIAYTANKQVEHVTTHLHVADAAAKVDQAGFHLGRCAEDIDSHARAGTSPSPVNRARMRHDCAVAVRLCLEAVELLWRDTGGSGLYTTNPLGRGLADLQAMNVHGGLMVDTAAELYGRMLVGLEPNTPLL
ncbi:MAG: acyl-CoA dehydrogenase family protein [Vicinamibacterales bacterium]